MRSRIYGIETEYGLLIKDNEFKFDPVQAAIRIKDHIFKSSRLGVLDQHYRANDEPPENGGFLLNAGRIYLDMGHLEYASPELKMEAKAVRWITKAANTDTHEKSDGYWHSAANAAAW